VVKIAKKRVSYRTRIKKVYRGRKGGNGGFKPVMDGAIAGVAGGVLTRFIGNWGVPAGALAVGMWRNNTTLKTEGGRELGLMLAQNIPFLGGSTNGSGGFE